jgi:hypothetical protein
LKASLNLGFAALALLAPTAAVADIPLPSPVPAPLAGSAGLQQRHDALVVQRNRIDGEIDTQNADCSQVAPDDQAGISACKQSQQRILGEMDAYQTALAAYERDLKIIPVPSQIEGPPPPQIAGTSESIDIVCGQLDSELDRMSQANLKIVGVEMDALGKLTVRVPVAVLIGGTYEASEPPEDVLDEARETLLRVADLSEQIDELNGKRKWRDEERRWVLAHVYVATPGGNYSVSTSDQPAHGQTAFDELRKMPAFHGCAIDREGKKYIPQVLRAQ